MLIIFAKSFTLDAWLGFEYTSAVNLLTFNLQLL